MRKTKYYSIAVGRKVGVFLKWFGTDGAQINVQGFKGAIYKSFETIEEAENFIKEKRNQKRISSNNPSKNNSKSNIEIYTDGCSLGNPGPGGYGIVIIENKKQIELSEGFRYTTNNRMELMACIIGLKEIKEGTRVNLYSDSKYTVNGIEKGWAYKWKKNNWMKTNKEEAKNNDLWNELLNLCSKHKVNFKWVKGHAGNPNNERCDKLANLAANGKKLNIDKIYELYSKKNNLIRNINT